MSKLSSWKAGLLAFLLASILFAAVPFPEDVPVGRQVAMLIAVQAVFVIITIAITVALNRRAGFVFDLGRPPSKPAGPKPDRLRLVHSREEHAHP